MGNEGFPWHSQLSELMHNNNLDDNKVINAIKLLWVWFPLCKHIHPLYVFANEVWYTHHSNPSKMHKQFDMIGIKSGEPSLTSEVFNDEFH